jgi:hypothetical protein
MADDDEIELDPEAEFEETEDEEIDPVELDEDELDDELVEIGEDDDLLEGDEDFVAVDEEEEDDDTSGPVRRSVTTEDEDEDDDMIAPDDVEADLDTILKDRLVAADDEDEPEEDEPEERGETVDRIQPKRADEQLCPSCFLLVRQSAPGCPVGDDDCPLFRR